MGSLNYQDILAAQYFPFVILLAHEDTSPLMLDSPYGSYFSISDPNNLHCEIKKVTYHFGSKIHGYIVHYPTAHVIDQCLVHWFTSNSR